ncbi:hypothetical protein NIES2107_53530 [Nostoc carneum NIES-2107]|nr:hypothetical protein NIES2107_53530 [Nostoc carneum NIES-2107]
MTNKHILLSSNILPGMGTGTRIILKRHLENLEAHGWQVSLTAPEHELQLTNNIPNTWNIIPLPSRRWWWPPYRKRIHVSHKLRLSLFQSQCEFILNKKLPTAILTHLTGSIDSLLASHLSKTWNVPLSVIAHDQEELYASSDIDAYLTIKRTKVILEQAERIWFVSPELEKIYQLGRDKKTSILFPISESRQHTFVEWKSSFGTAPIIAHAGWLYSSQFSNLYELALALQKFNGKLLIVAAENDPTLCKLLELCPNILHHEPFEKNSGVIDFLENNASCILVSYSFEQSEQPWAKTSFPSKFVEFSHIGLPIMIMAPSDTAISNWARRYKWLSYINKLEPSILFQNIAKLTEKETWLAMAQQTREVALHEFHPKRIQEQFESELAIYSPQCKSQMQRDIIFRKS